ncbi:unnamed protein product [Nippostrongylus brasiliensis]|uniref:SUI1 domain-containing protein n=1 Tax=Nippostrongylus brasiliensis TaxID=27835 RepID=A0A0N4YBA5_NIPBR|nr:unnamed protein product [Nippostrongylus brasiliensis]
MAKFSEVLKSVQLSSTFSKALLESQLKDTFPKSSKDSPQASKASAENATYSSGRDRKSRSGQGAERSEKPRKRRATKTREDSKETSGDRVDLATEQLLPDPYVHQLFHRYFDFSFTFFVQVFTFSLTFPSAERKVELAKRARAVTPLPPALVAPVIARGLVSVQRGQRLQMQPEFQSIVSEKETVNQFFYTVTKGNRRCTIPGKMYSKRLPDSWVHINFVLFDEDGSELLNLNTDIMREALRNTFVNGKPVTFVQ